MSASIDAREHVRSPESGDDGWLTSGCAMLYRDFGLALNLTSGNADRNAATATRFGTLGAAKRAGIEGNNAARFYGLGEGD